MAFVRSCFCHATQALYLTQSSSQGRHGNCCEKIRRNGQILNAASCSLFSFLQCDERKEKYKAQSDAKNHACGTKLAPLNM
jgi:hypothetical protein